MKIKGLVTIYAGSDIHPPGTVFQINDADGQDLVGRGFAEAVAVDRKSTRLNSSHIQKSRMPSSA